MYVVFFVIVFILLVRNEFKHSRLNDDNRQTYRELNRQITLLNDEIKMLESRLGLTYVKNTDKAPTHKFIEGEERARYLKKLERERELWSCGRE